MNTSVTRGRAELIVTATGMNTEIGNIAGMLNQTEAEKTPLQKKLEELTRVFILLGGIAIVAVIVLGLFRGEDLETLFITGVALAIACIPTGLPVVVTTLLSLGTRELARTARHREEVAGGGDAGIDLGYLLRQDRHLDAEQDDSPGDGNSWSGNRFKVTGEGYCDRWADTPYRRPEPRPRPVPAADDPVQRRRAGWRISSLAIRRKARSSSWRRRAASISTETRRDLSPHCRSPVRLRVQVHGDVPPLRGADDGSPVVRCFVKGAPDMVIGRSSPYCASRCARTRRSPRRTGNGLST